MSDRDTDTERPTESDTTTDAGGVLERSRVVHVSADGVRAQVVPATLDAPDDGWIWLDVIAPTDDDARELARRFDLDRVTRDDIVEPQSAKYEDLDRYRVVVVHALAPDPDAIRTVEVDIVVGDDWLLTIHDEAVSSIDHLIGRVVRPQFAVDGPLHLAFRIMEFVGERYLPILDDLDAQVLDLEDEAVEGDPSVLPDIHALRRDVAVLRRSLGPQRRALEALARSVEVSAGRANRDLADAIDHHVRMVDSLDGAHQMVATLLDTYRGATAERMNEVMKVLTVLSAIFMPLTLIAGIYGMNFEDMPELGWSWGYSGALGLMAAIAFVLWVYFIRRGFIGGPKVRDLARPARAAGRVGRGLASAATLPIRVATRSTNQSSRE